MNQFNKSLWIVASILWFITDISNKDYLQAIVWLCLFIIIGTEALHIWVGKEEK